MKKYSLVLLLLLAACYNPRLDIATMPKPPKHGHPSYIDGWQAGCETGMTAYGNSYMKTRYRTNFDGHRMEDPIYSRGWSLGQRYCSYYSSTYLANTELAYLSNDSYTSSDARGEDTWFSLKSDGWFSYDGFDRFSW